MGMKLYCSNHDKLNFQILESTCDLGNQPTPINVLYFINKGERNMLLIRSYLFLILYRNLRWRRLYNHVDGKYTLKRFLSFTRVCILGCIILLKYLRRACKVSQGASTLFKVC